MRWPVVLASLLCLGGQAATGDEVATGGNERFERATPPRYVHVFTIYNMEDQSASVLAFGAGTRVGDAYDVVDGRGYVGRLMVDRVELRGCGDAHYYDVQTRFVSRRPGRAPEATVALALAP